MEIVYVIFVSQICMISLESTSKIRQKFAFLYQKLSHFSRGTAWIFDWCKNLTKHKTHLKLLIAITCSKKNCNNSKTLSTLFHTTQNTALIGGSITDSYIICVHSSFTSLPDFVCWNLDVRDEMKRTRIRIKKDELLPGAKSKCLALPSQSLLLHRLQKCQCPTKAQYNTMERVM